MAVPAARLRPRPDPARNPRRQAGVALIMAIMVVALATIAAAAMASRQQLDVRRTANLLDSDQAYAYALAVEGWARMILARDARDNQTDHLDEVWAQRLPPIGVAGGQIDGYVADLQGRFNLNNLVGADGQVSTADFAYFQRLLRALGIDDQLALAILDWLDADFDTRFPAGAEDDFYLSTPTPYRAANRPLQSVSELRLIRGVDAETWRRLAPFVTALPGRTAINVNTAAAPLLQAIAEGLTTQDGEQLVEKRPADGYASVDLLLQDEIFAGKELDDGGLTVVSQFFLVRSDVRVGTARAQVYSIVQRNADQLVTLARTQGTW